MTARARLNVPFGASLTGVAQLPRGAKVAVGDRFGQRPAAWPKLVAAAVIIGFLYSLLNDYGVIRRLTDGAFGDPAGSRPGLEVLITPADETEPPPAE